MTVVNHILTYPVKELIILDLHFVLLSVLVTCSVAQFWFGFSFRMVWRYREWPCVTDLCTVRFSRSTEPYQLEHSRAYSPRLGHDSKSTFSRQALRQGSDSRWQALYLYSQWWWGALYTVNTPLFSMPSCCLGACVYTYTPMIPESQSANRRLTPTIWHGDNNAKILTWCTVLISWLTLILKCLHIWGIVHWANVFQPLCNGIIVASALTLLNDFLISRQTIE